MSNLNKDKATLYNFCTEIDIDGIKNFLSQHQHLLNEALSPLTDHTLLMIGCLNRWDEIVEYLLSNYSKTLKVNIRTKYGDTALYYAVAYGTIKCVRLLLLLSHRNIDVHLPCGRFNKPAFWYCYNRECYDLFFREPKYTINENEKKMAWLWSLCRSDGVKEVKNILETIPPDILPQMKDDVSVMVVLAAERGETKILKYLLSSYGDLIDINRQDQDGNTALSRAIEENKKDCVKLLVASPNIKRLIGNESKLLDHLYEAIFLYNTEILRDLLNNPNFNVNKRFHSGCTALWFAVGAGRIECVKLLLSHPDIDVNINCGEFEKPVLWNCKNKACYDLLLPYFPVLSEDEKRMAWLWSLCLYGKDDVEEAEKLMNRFSRAILHQMKDDVSRLIISLTMKSKTQIKIIKCLLTSCGSIIDINFKDKDGNTALFYAVRYGELEVIKLFLSQRNININLQTGEFDKPVLWYCHDKECYEFLERLYTTRNESEKKMAWLCSLLSSYGAANVEEVKDIMETIHREVLHQDEVSVLVLLAAEKGAADIIEYLLSSYGDIIDINIQDKNGRSSLHRAFHSYSGDCINVLNKYNVDLGLRDKDGRTAFELSQSEFQRTSLRTKMNIFSMIFNRSKVKVKWNRCKIMLVGQGRAGKTSLANNLAGKWKEETPSTIGAEQMDMQLFYGEVQRGRLEEYERPKQEFEALLVEQSFPGGKRRMNTGRDDIMKTVNTEYNQESAISSKLPSRKEVDNSILQDEMQISTSQKKTETSINLRDYEIDLDTVDLHCRLLEEVNTASSYKLILVDFGGQSIFNVLHAFFMSKHGIYLVVFDMELFMSDDAVKRESCRKELKFWLNSITMYTSVGTGKTAPVAIVGTRGDKISSKKKDKEISSELKALFGKMKVWQSLMCYKRDGQQLCFFPNDNTNTENNIVSQQLLSSIEHSLVEAESMKEEIDLLWIKIFDEMKATHQSYLLFEDVVNIAQKKLVMRERVEKLKRIKKEVRKEVREMLRFLNFIGMLMWIEESGLSDVIILDPIEYLVKPATTIICKHLATKDDPYRTIHEIPEIHGASKIAHHDDWMKMLESGLVSDELVRDLLTRYYRKNASQQIHIETNVEKVSQMMIKFGLMVPLFPPSAAIDYSQVKRNHYIVPSLLPSAPFLQNTNEDDNELDMLFRRLRKKHKILKKKRKDIGMQYSLYYFLPLDGLSTAKIATKSACYDVISSSELSSQGFLPHSLFERLICRFIQDIIRHEDIIAMDQLLIDNELITGFRGKVQFPYRDHNIRMIERREENRIEVIIQSHELADKEKEKEIFQEIHKRSVEVMEGLLNECYEGLLVKTLLHLPSPSSGFVTLERVRSLLTSSNQVKPKQLNSYDGTCQETFVAEEMKKDPYWSVWKEKEMIPPLLLDSSLPSSQLPLTAGKKTHVFLSHDWGIDGNNHHRVKQVSEALKSRGLFTWIDDERIVNEIDNRIINGIKHSECMLVFVTETYVKKLNSSNHMDWCKREFHYGFKKLTPERMIFIVLDKSMKDPEKWADSMIFNLSSSFLYFDLSDIFEAPYNLSNKRVKKKMKQLYKKIVEILQLENEVKEEDDNDRNVDPIWTKGKKEKKKRKIDDELLSEEVVVDNDEGVLSSDNNLNNEKKKKKEQEEKEG